MWKNVRIYQIYEMFFFVTLGMIEKILLKNYMIY